MKTEFSCINERLITVLQTTDFIFIEIPFNVYLERLNRMAKALFLFGWEGILSEITSQIFQYLFCILCKY